MISYTNILYNQEYQAEITARDKAGNTETSKKEYQAEQIFKENTEQPELNEAGKTTRNLAEILKNTEITGLTITSKSSNPEMITASIQGLTITYKTKDKDYNTEEYTPVKITLTAKTTLTNNQEATIGETEETPKVNAEPDVYFHLTSMLTPNIDPDFKQPPPINGRIIIAKLTPGNNTIKALYNVPEDTKINAYQSPVSSKVTVDTTQINNGEAKIQLTPGTLYRWIIQADGYYERISGNKTLTSKDLEEKIELADKENLPLAHTTTVAYGGNADEATIYDLSHGSQLSRIVTPFDSVYISLLPAKGSGNPVPDGWPEIIRSIYENDLQGNFMKTKLYPQGILHNIKIVQGTNPPPNKTPRTIIYQADDTIPFFAAFGASYKGFNHDEIYSITISYITGFGNYDPRAVFLHEAASLFRRSNSSPNDGVPSIWDDPSPATNITASDKALLHFIFSRPTDLRWFDRQYK